MTHIRKKIAVIGAGQIGGTAAGLLAMHELGDVVLVDIVEGLPQGKALDLAHMGAIYGRDSQIKGTNDISDIKGADIVIVTSGVPRRPGMTREDLIKTNSEIVSSVSKNIAAHAPGSIVIMIANPLDAMTFLAYKLTQFERSRIIGMAGILDSARFRAFLAAELNASVNSVNAFVLGSHGDTMVPSTTYTTLGGVPVKEILSRDKLEAIIERTRKGGAEIVSLLKTGSAYYAPAAAAVQMTKSILRDKKELLPCTVYAQGEYGLKDTTIGLPVILGAGGVEKIVEFKLPPDEEEALKESARAVKKTCDELYALSIL